MQNLSQIVFVIIPRKSLTFFNMVVVIIMSTRPSSPRIFLWGLQGKNSAKKHTLLACQLISKY